MRIVTTLLLATLGLSAAAQTPGEPRETFSIPRDQPLTGSMIRGKAVERGQVPFGNSWAELTDDQRAIVRAWYEDMKPEDEPPYPLYGTKSLYKAISDLQKLHRVEGELSLFVTVEADGKASSVDVVRSPDPELTRGIAMVLVAERYKPALCKGVPCSMQFPVRVRFELK